MSRIASRGRRVDGLWGMCCVGGVERTTGVAPGVLVPRLGVVCFCLSWEGDKNVTSNVCFCVNDGEYGIGRFDAPDVFCAGWRRENTSMDGVQIKHASSSRTESL